MLYLIGLGLGDKEDITIKGFKRIEKSTKVYLENYTSQLLETSLVELVKFWI